MTRNIDEELLTILYHRIGTDAASGILAFENVFRSAEADYRVNDMRALLSLLHDRTLFDPSLPAWHDYFSIRVDLVQWQLAKATQSLEILLATKKGDTDALQLRLGLLRAQVQVMRGEWTSGLRTLRTVSRQMRDLDTPLLAVDRDEWMARAYVGRAQSSGDWEVASPSGSSHVWRYFMIVALFPLYLLAYVVLRHMGVKGFWTAVLQHGSEVSNWPIFAYYLSAYQALDRALEQEPQLARDRAFGLRILRTDILRRIGNLKAAESGYKILKEDFGGEEEFEYEGALINHGLGQVYLGMAKSIDARECLDQAKCVYDAMQARREDTSDAEMLSHRRLSAHIEILLGDLAHQNGLTSEAIGLWDSALRVFQQLNDALGTAEVLNRLYAVVENYPHLSPDLRQQAKDCVKTLSFCVYPLRMPNWLFAILQSIGWMLPLLALIVVGALVSGVIIGPPREQVAQQAASVLSAKFVLEILGVAVMLLLVNSALAMMGLISSFWMDATRLDVFVTDESRLVRTDCLGVVLESIPWVEVDLFLRVERCFWRRPSRLFSYDYLRSTKGSKIRLPGMTSRFPWLQHDIEQRTTKVPIRYRLRWYGGIAVIAVPFALALTFTLTQTCMPWMSVSSHAWLASIVAGVGYILLAVFGVSIIWHYVQVGSQTTSPKMFRWAVATLGLLMLALGTVGRDLGTIFSPFFALGGMVLLLAWFHGVSERWRIERRRLVRATNRVIIVAGAILSLWSVAPILLSYHAYTYSGAASLLRPDCSTEGLDDRGRCFDAMRRSGELITQIDPTFYNGYAYMGLAHYQSLDYDQSIKDFTRAIYFNRVRPYPDYFYCRALAYMRNGQNAEAQRDCRRFQERRSSNGITLCERLFPEDAGACAEQ